MKLLFLFILVVYLFSCKSGLEVSDIDQVPEVLTEDLQFAHVYKALNGSWKGLYRIYNYRGSDHIDLQLLRNLRQSFENFHENLTLVDSIWVERMYESESPFFQRVTIRDSHWDREGGMHSHLSNGVNKIQEGQLWCVIKKTDETVIHKGEVEGNAIVWQRNEDDPMKMEYFIEYVEDDVYHILGWGYYGNDDITKMPSHFFKGILQKTSD